MGILANQLEEGVVSHNFLGVIVSFFKDTIDTQAYPFFVVLGLVILIIFSLMMAFLNFLNAFIPNKKIKKKLNEIKNSLTEYEKHEVNYDTKNIEFIKYYDTKKKDLINYCEKDYNDTVLWIEEKLNSLINSYNFILLFVIALIIFFNVNIGILIILFLFAVFLVILWISHNSMEEQIELQKETYEALRKFKRAM